MFAYRNVSEEELQANPIDLKSEDFEKELNLLGVTGVEDELQNDVASTIIDFRNAGIKFCMITGDKGPTAKTISSTTGCLSKEM
jgi:phospholipid-translocating ATPase